jgi:hypothetical protein
MSNHFRLDFAPLIPPTIPCYYRRYPSFPPARAGQEAGVAREHLQDRLRLPDAGGGAPHLCLLRRLRPSRERGTLSLCLIVLRRARVQLESFKKSSGKVRKLRKKKKEALDLKVPRPLHVCV